MNNPRKTKAKPRDKMRIPPVKQYDNLREVGRDLNIIQAVFRAARLKKPDDPFEKDFTPPKGAKPPAVVRNPKEIPSVIQKRKDGVRGRPKRPSTAPQEDAEDQDTEENVPAAVDQETKELEEDAPTFNIGVTPEELEEDAPTKIEVSGTNAEKLDTWNKQLKVMFDLREKINNIINTLSHSFANTLEDKERHINKAIENAKNIQGEIREEINTLRKSISNITEISLPTGFKRFCTAVMGRLETLLKENKHGKIEAVFQGGTNKNDNFQLTCFFVVTGLETGKGNLPHFIVAISVIGNNYYVNPALLRLPAINDFTPGFMVKNSREASRYVQEQLIFLDTLDTVQNSAVPPALTNLGIRAVKNVTGVTFSNTEVTVTTKKVPNVKDLANQIYTIFFSAIYDTSPRTARNTKIIYAIQETEGDGGFTITYKFTKTDKFTGRTLQRDEVEVLRKVFSDEDIRNIHYILNSSEGKSEASRLTEKAHAMLTRLHKEVIKKHSLNPSHPSYEKHLNEGLSVHPEWHDYTELNREAAKARVAEKRKNRA